MADRLIEMRAVADMPGASMRIASEDLRVIVARIDAQAAEIERLKATAARADTQAAVLRTVERWANHHARKPKTTAEEALGVIQHHPAIREITASYADGVVPDTPDPYAEIERLRDELALCVLSAQARISGASEMIDTTKFDGHTAGPWSVGPWFDNDGEPEIMIEHMTPRGNLVPAVALGGLTGQEANARLIAAAPDLLAEVIRLRAEVAALKGGAA